MPRLLAVLRARKHLSGGHDQEDHGNWATGGSPQYEAGKWKDISDPAALDAKILDNVTKTMVSMYKGKYTYGEIRRVIEKKYWASRNEGRVIANGNIQIRLPQKPAFSDEKIKEITASVDRALAFAPKLMLGNKNFPVEINLGKQNDGITIGKYSSSVAGANHDVTVDPSAGGIITVRGDLFKGSADKTTLEYLKERTLNPEGWWAEIANDQKVFDWVVAHELGHAVASFNARVVSGDPYTNKLFREYSGPVTEYGGNEKYISKYGQQDSGERYAEHFAAYTYGQADPLTLYLAEQSLWGEGSRK